VLCRVRPALPRELGEGGRFVGAVAAQPAQGRVLVSVEDKPTLVDGRLGLEELPDHVRGFQLDAVLDGTASQGEVVQALDLQQGAESVLAGVNCTVLAYGMTGSGKTHTMGTSGGRDGVIPRAADTLFQLSGQADVAASYVQLYGNRITDLLVSEGAPLVLREADGRFQVQGAAHRAVRSTDDVCRLLAEGAARRAVGSTNLNAVSSRSHAVFTLHVLNEDEDHVSEAHWTFADLAGSERVKESGVSGAALAEACSINSSLNALVNVVRALREGSKAVPYRDNRLTMLLREALGGNSATWLLATVSPAQVHGRESANTLAFAVACSSISNAVAANRSKRHAPWREPPKARKERPAPLHLPWASAEFPRGDVRLVAAGLRQVAVTVYGEGRPAVLLHGYPSDASSWRWLVPALLHAGYQAIAVDMPGCGHSPGPELKTHSRFNAEAGGACEVVLGTMDALGLGRATLVGYDWGGGVALSLALGWRSRCERVVAFHPSFNAAPGQELATVCTPLLVVWVKEDQFHPLAAWKKVASGLAAKAYTLEVFSVGVNRGEGSYGTHPVVGGPIQARIARFLGWVDPSAEGVELKRRLERDAQTTGGARVVEQRNVVLAEDMQDAAIARSLTESVSAEAAAVLRLREAAAEGRLADLYAAAPSGLFSALPELSPSRLAADMEVLLWCGLWAALPKGWDAMSRSPRYFPGRRVLVRAPVCARPASDAYMAWDSDGAVLTTHRATISALGEAAEVAVELHGGGSHVMGAARQGLEALNQPHKFKEVREGICCFEDGIRCNYNSPLTKAKMCEAALLLAPLVAQLDFEEDPRVAEELQLECIRRLRSCLGIVSFQRGLDRGRACAMADDAARLAVHGQGHCHTVSSVMCAFLYPWAPVLGLDLCYRGGFSFRGVNPDDSISSDVVVADRPERHQWLEVSLRPSMRRFVVDLWVQDGPMGEGALRWDAEEAYQHRMYPHGQLCLGQTTERAVPTDWAAVP
ncbi:unnamed protein product, partial [Prorocentrum cordatum]